jgi:hypothetical protein
MLFDPPQPATAGVAAPPMLNVGEMRNRGIDFSIGYSKRFSNGVWGLTLNGSAYKNEIINIDGVTDFFFGPQSTRYGNQVINQVGSPIGAFYGLEWAGYFADDADAADYLPPPSDPNAPCAVACQDGADPGRFKFVDQPTDNDGDGTIDGPDGIINADDRVIIGSPHPDITMGLDFTLTWGAFDFNATLFTSIGNDIFEVQKEFYVFRNFSTNVRREMLTDSWEPGDGGDKTSAKYAQLDINDTFSGQQLSSYYVEDGSYLRLRSLVIGYRIPQSFAWLAGFRVYLAAENLFTITGYPGLDPALPASAQFGAAGDVRDQYRGVDRGAYPSNRFISLGINATFNANF